VGLSRNPRDFSHAVFRELSGLGYDLVPVNPVVKELEQKRCFASVQEIVPPVEGALLMTSPTETEQAVRDCAMAGIRRVWMHRGAGQGAVSQSTVDFCRENNIRLVEGYCPLTFLRHEAYRAHGFMLKLVGHYPAAA
jgi:predicted CoA-binding protein